MIFKRIMLGLLLALVFMPAHGQPAPTPPGVSVMSPVQPVSLAVTSSSARVALPDSSGNYRTVTVINLGTAEVFCKPGGSSVTATTSSYQFSIPPNGYRAYFAPSASTYIACVTSTGTATERITQTNGGPTIGLLYNGGTSGPCSDFGTTTGTCAQGNDSRIVNAAQVVSKGTFTANGVTPVVVTDAAATKTDFIFISLNTPGGTVGTSLPDVQSISEGVSFTVKALALDTSTYNYAILSLP